MPDLGKQLSATWVPTNTCLTDQGNPGMWGPVFNQESQPQWGSPRRIIGDFWMQPRENRSLLLSQPSRNPPRSMTHFPASPRRSSDGASKPGPSLAACLPRPVLWPSPRRPGPHPQLRASPSPRFNYMIDFRLDCARMPLPATV